MYMGKSVVVFGSVKSSDVVLRELIAQHINVLKVYSLDENAAQNVSGYYPIHHTAENAGIPNCTFVIINERKILNDLKSMSPDYIFVVGLSQLVSEEILDIAVEGVIGLHPAPLPKYRGRAAMVWQMLLGEKSSAVTFFFIDKGMDSGDIIVQEPFEIGETDYAIDVDQKALEALGRGIQKVVRMISEGTVCRIKQDETKATYLMKRTPEDGKIYWDDHILDIHRLIRAVSRPYPGAFSFYDGRWKVTIWRADILENTKYIGMNGQICNVGDEYFDVICPGGILHVYDYDIENNEGTFKWFIVGHKFKDGNI